MFVQIGKQPCVGASVGYHHYSVDWKGGGHPRLFLAQPFFTGEESELLPGSAGAITVMQ